MAKGLPLVLTKVGGIPDIIRNGQNGILISPKSSEEIAKAVKLLMKDKELRNKIIKGGYEFIKRHTAERQARKISNTIYEYISEAYNS
jgi:glycosyltransferase involved in cell wall biosynthesis